MCSQVCTSEHKCAAPVYSQMCTCEPSEHNSVAPVAWYLISTVGWHQLLQKHTTAIRKWSNYPFLVTFSRFEAETISFCCFRTWHARNKCHWFPPSSLFIYKLVKSYLGGNLPGGRGKDSDEFMQTWKKIWVEAVFSLRKKMHIWALKQ